SVNAGPIVSFFTIAGQRVAAQSPREVTVTEPGPLRCRIELRGHYAADFDYVVRVDAFANQPFVRVFHSFEQHSSEAYTVVRQIGSALPLALTGTPAYSAGVDGGTPLSGELPANGLSLVQDDNEGFRVGTGDADARRHAGHAAGWVDLHDTTGGVAVIGRY